MMGSLTLWMWYTSMIFQITTDLGGFVFLMIVISDVLQFFDKTKLDAIKALDIYRRTGNLVRMTVA